MLARLQRWWRKGRARLALPEALESSLQTLSRRFDEERIAHAVIGGIAVSLHGPPRFTKDLDFLIDSAHVERAHLLMEHIGFETLQQTKIFANYLLRPLRVDFLYTQGELMRSMIARAAVFEVGRQSIKTAQPEDLIALKLQAVDNAPERGRDQIDILNLLERFHTTMDMALVRKYFVLFNKEDELEKILDVFAKRGG